MRRWMALVLLLACDSGEPEGGSAAADGGASASDVEADSAAQDALVVSDTGAGGEALDVDLDGGARGAEANAGAADAGGLVDAGQRTRDPDVPPADTGPSAQDPDTLPGVDAGPTGGHTPSDALAAADAGPAPGDTAADVSWTPPGEETTKALLIGRWQMVAVADSGNPKEPVPPGAQFFAFRSDQTLASTCEAPGGAPWTLSADGSVLSVWFSPDAAIEWTILLLTAQEFVFYEGGDVFYHERTEDCP